MTASSGVLSATDAGPEVDWRRVGKWGLFTGVAMVFVAAVGMIEAFDRRRLIDPILSLGYASVGWVPLIFGYVAAHKETKEGMAAPVRGVGDLVAGLVAGLIGGVTLFVFTWIIDSLDLRDIFPKLSPVLVRLLTFDRGLGFAAVALIGGTGLLGLLGGAAQILPAQIRKGIAGALQWTFAVAVIQTAVVDVFEELRLTAISDRLYEVNGGLTLIGAIVVAVVTGLLTWRFSGGMTGFRARLRQASTAERSRFNVTLAIVGVILVVGLPIVLGGLNNELLANVGLFLLMALGLNIVVGQAGLLDLGYVAFFAVGAYTTAVLTSPFSPRYAPAWTLDFLHWQGWAILAIVIGLGAIAGILVGTPVIRMRGDYLAIVTLGFGEIVRIMFLSDWLAPVFGGAQGIRRIPSAAAGPIDIKGTSPQQIFYLVAIFVAIAIYVSWRLQYSRIGRAWSAMREDESVAESMGIDTVTAKLLAFVTGAILAAFGGMIFAVKVGSVFPNSFELLVSIIVLVVVIVGGMGNIPGVLVGALLLIGVLGGPTQPGLLQEFQEFKLLIYGALLVYMMLQRPEGLVPSARRSQELHQEEYLQDAWLDKATATGEVATERAT